MNLLNRSGLAAIAAATAFIATPALAQDATPVADSTPIVADTPLPNEPVAVPEAASDTLAPAPVAAPAKRTIKPTRPATTATRNTTPVRAATPLAPVTAPVAAAPAQMEAPADPAMVAPLPEPVSVAPIAPVATVASNDDMLPIAGAAGLGILALAGAGFAMRRRRRDDDVVVEDSFVEPQDMVAAPIAAAPMATTTATAPIPAFAWGDQVATPVPAATPSGLSRIEAAKRGPTPDNPSASLNKRLSRAAFFDQRERAVAAGKAVAVSPMAGLPERLARAAKPLRRTEPSLRFDRRFQPA